MKSLKKLALSAIAFAMLFGGKPVLAEEQDFVANMPSETEVVSAEGEITDNTSGVDAENPGKNTSLLSSEIAVKSGNTVTGSVTGHIEAAPIITCDDASDLSTTDEDGTVASVTTTDGDGTVTSVTTTDGDGTVTSVTTTDGDGTVGSVPTVDGEDTVVPAAEKVKHLTVLDGVDYALVYDYEYYSANEDVKAAFGDNEEQTLYNFVRWGMISQRQGIATFDEVSYRYAYQDLRLAFGTDYKAYYLHYINSGYSEGRAKTTGITEILHPVTVEGGVDYAAVYDYDYYSANADVAAAFGDDDIATLHNFVRWGMQGGRQGSAEFNVYIYQKNYPSLQTTYGSNLPSYYLHYVRWGKTAGLVADQRLPHQAVTVLNGVDYRLVYSYEYYHANEDVAEAFGDDEEATLYNFVRWGMLSGRQGCADFDVYSYRNAYSDLRAAYGSDLTKYYLHYIYYGYAEGRNLTTGVTKRLQAITVQDGIDYSAVYDFSYFQEMYPDVKEAFGDDEVATLANFVRWGMEGGRQGSEEFNVYNYRKNCPELQYVYGYNLPGYYMHYIRWGKEAGLIANVTIIEVSSCLITDDNNVELTASVNGYDTEQTFGLFVLATGQKQITSSSPLATTTGLHSIIFITSLNLNTSASLLTEKLVIGLRKASSFTQISEGYYITNPEAVAENTRSFPTADSKKGLQVNTGMINDAADLGVNHAVINITINMVVGESSGIPYTYNGKTYYMDTSYVSELDSDTETLASKGIIVTAVVLMPWDSYESDLIIPSGRQAGYSFYGFNTEEKDPRDHIAAIFSFLVERYSDQNHNVVNWIVGNEVNAYKAWHWCGNVDIDTYTEYYTDSFRLFYNCAKSKYSNARVYISLDQWFNGYSSSYAYTGKDVLTRFADRLKDQGDITWCIAIHPYARPLTTANFWAEKTEVTYSEDSPAFTMLNLNYLTGYIKNTYGAEHRFSLTEIGYTSYSDGVMDEKLQAAALAYAYYRAEFEDIYDMIDSFIVHRQVDNKTEMAGGLYLGLWNNNSSREEVATSKKQSWTVYKYMDTAESEEYTDYLLDTFGVDSWEEIIPGYDPSRFA